MTKSLRFSLLGAPHITFSTEELTQRWTPKVSALFIYLAVNGQISTRDVLADLLWSELPAQKARNNLRYTLPHLRAVVDEYLFITAQTVGFNHRQPYQLDVGSFRTVVTAALDTELSRMDSVALQNALDLYRGEFLAGFRVRNAPIFEAWVTACQEEYHLLALQGLQRLAEKYLTIADYRAGLATTQRLLGLEPWHETGHHLRMQCFALNGQRGAALAQFDLCRTILADELGIVPKQETVDLYTQIRDDNFHPPSTAKRPTVPLVVTQPEAKAYAPGGQATPPSIPHNLPAALVPLIGYEEELAFVLKRLTNDRGRLLTIVGIGGVGKTLLALVAAKQLSASIAAVTQYSDGIYFVALDGLAEQPERALIEMEIGLAIANAIGFTLRGQQPPQTQLQQYLRTKKMLLILDNVEHLIDGAQVITPLLQAASDLRVLATSREPLDLQAEQLVRLHGLNPPSDRPSAPRGAAAAGELRWQDNHAVTLFAYYAQLTERNFVVDEANAGDIVQICELVDGLPLGIEMAARWLVHLDCKAILRELARSLDILTTTRRDSALRHQTLRAVFNQSWILLSQEEQRLLLQLAIFRPNFSAAAAHAVTGASLQQLAALVNKSLLNKNGGGHFTMHRTVRHFSQEKLDRYDGFRSTFEQQYLAYYLGQLARSDDMYAPQWAAVKAGFLQEIDNVKAALQLALSYRRWRELLGALETVGHLHDQQGWFLEGAEFCRMVYTQLESSSEALSLHKQYKTRILRGFLLTMQGWYNTRLGRSAMARSLYQKGLVILRAVCAELGAAEGAFPELAHIAQTRLGSCLRYYGLFELWQDQPLIALDLLQKVQQLEDKKSHTVMTEYGLSEVMFRLGHYVEAQAHSQAALLLARELGAQYYTGIMIMQLGMIEEVWGNYPAALRLYEDGHTMRAKLGVQGGVAHTMLRYARIARLQGDYELAQNYLEIGINSAAQINQNMTHAELYWELGNLALAQKEYQRAQQHFLQSRGTTGFNLLRIGLPTLGWAYMGLADWAAAEAYVCEVIGLALPIHAHHNLMEAFACLVVLLCLAGALADPSSYFAAVEQCPATTKETKVRMHTMYRLMVESHAHNLTEAANTYQPDPAALQMVDQIMDEISTERG